MLDLGWVRLRGKRLVAHVFLIETYLNDSENI